MVLPTYKTHSILEPIFKFKKCDLYPSIYGIWNEDSKCIYKEFIENKNLMKNIATYDNKNFPIALREHFDSDIHIEEKVIPMEYPEITQAELHKHLKKIKKNRATGPDNVKGELYRSLGRSEMCVGKLQTALQNIIDKDLKIKSWAKSYTRLIPKSQETNSQADETNCTN